MRVLVTRPQPGCARTVRRLTDLGFEPVPLPVTEAVHHTEALRAAIDRSWAAIALTSANAARAVAASPGAIAAWRKLPVFAVGPRTADAAGEAGFSAVISADGDGGDLATLIARQEAMVPDPVLYCAGRPRAADFERQMAAAHVRFETVEVYEMRACALAPAMVRETLLAAPFGASLFYSRATVDVFLALAERIGVARQLRLGRILCLSEQVRAGLPAELRAGALAVDAPSEDRLLEMLAGMPN